MCAVNTSKGHYRVH